MYSVLLVVYYFNIISTNQVFSPFRASIQLIRALHLIWFESSFAPPETHPHTCTHGHIHAHKHTGYIIHNGLREAQMQPKRKQKDFERGFKRSTSNLRKSTYFKSALGTYHPRSEETLCVCVSIKKPTIHTHTHTPSFFILPVFKMRTGREKAELGLVDMVEKCIMI